MNRRLTTRLAAAAPDVEKGVRAAVVMLVPYYLAGALERPELAWTALGGWLGTLVDPGGTRATRAKVLVAFALVGAGVVAMNAALASSPWLAPVGLAVAVFVLSLLRAAGGAAGGLGAILALVAAIASGRGTTPVVEALCFGGGALLAVVLSSVVWPVWTHLPVRRAVGYVYRELAAYLAAAQAAIAEGAPHGDERWNALMREHHVRVRGAIEAARQVALAVRTRRIGETRLGGNVRALLGEAEAQFPVLSTFVQELEALPPSARAEPGHVLARVAAADREVERLLVTPVIRTYPTVRRARRTVPPADVLSAAQVIGARLEALGAVAVDLARVMDAPPADEAPAPGGAPRAATDPRGRAATGAPVAAAPSALREGLRTLTDALAPGSIFFRHALRAAGGALLASVVGHALSPHHVHWVTLTTLAILQPELGATMKRAGERVLGTLFGCLLAVAITETVQAPLALSALMVPLSIAAVATRARSYRLFTFFLTPVFVLVAERHPGDWNTAAERGADALLGGLVALVVAVLVFPSSERERLPDALGRMLEDAAAYVRSVFASLGERRAAGVGERIAATRRAAGLALGTAEASLERYLAEPLRDQAVATDAMLLVTYTRRLVAAVTSVDTLAAHSTIAAPVADAALVNAYLDEVLRAAQARVRSAAEAMSPGPPELTSEAETPIDAALDRALRWGALVASVAPGSTRGLPALGPPID